MVMLGGLSHRIEEIDGIEPLVIDYGFSDVPIAGGPKTTVCIILCYCRSRGSSRLLGEGWKDSFEFGEDMIVKLKVIISAKVSFLRARVF
ncbi:MAG: hypothetical protein WCV56_00335 [Candidatus Omnitrophota bacterium]